MEIDGILKFVELTHNFQKTERAIRVPGLERFENDVEHSYQLAMVAWYVVSAYKLSLNLDLVIKYALIHDLVEVYAGDTDATDQNPKVQAMKVEKEHQALQQLKSQFVEFPDMTALIEKYESKQDEEAVFVYSLDKILPTINIYFDKGRGFKDRDMDLKVVINHGSSRVAGHPEIKKYFDQLVILLEKEKHLLFKQDNA